MSVFNHLDERACSSKRSVVLDFFEETVEEVHVFGVFDWVHQ